MPPKVNRKQQSYPHVDPHHNNKGNTKQPPAPNKQLAVSGQPSPAPILIPTPSRTPSPDTQVGTLKLEDDTVRSVSPVKREDDFEPIMYENTDLERTAAYVAQAAADLPDFVPEQIPPPPRTPSPKTQAVSVQPDPAPKQAPPAPRALSSNAASEKSEEQVRRIRVIKTDEEVDPLMYVDTEIDRVASLINLAMIGIMADGSKMTKRAHCYAPKSPSMAAAASRWMPSAVNTAYLPDLVTSAIGRADRHFYTQDSREDLGFFGHCITYVHKLYPENTERSMFFWKQVKNGIITLKRQYKREPPIKLNEEMVARWELAGLKMGMTFDEMFDNWIAKVDSFLAGHEEVAVKHGNDGELLPDPIAASLIALLEAANSVKVDGQIAADTVVELKTVIESLLNTGKISRKLHPLSEKIKKLWSMDLIYQKIDEIEKLGREGNLTVKNVKLEEMIVGIDRIASQYAEIVKKEMIEVMSL